MLHDQFKDEAAFRSDFVRPLLTRLGYVGIAELHGAQEFGKDFVFAELTPFGFLKYHAAVVKHEASINQSARVLDDVLRQIREAFNVRFTISDSPDEHSVSSVYVFNSGKITDNANTSFRTELAKRDYGANVHIFDGERLHQLDLTASAQEQQRYLPRLQGLITQLGMNRDVWRNILANMPEFREPRGSFTSTIEDYLTAPFLTAHINQGDMQRILQECRIIDVVNYRMINCLFELSETFREGQRESLREVIALADARAQRLITEVQLLTGRLVPLSSMTATAIIGQTQSNDTTPPKL